MIWGTEKLTEAQVNGFYQTVFTQGFGPIVLAHLVHEECHLWDQISLDNHELVALHNLAKRVLIRTGDIREENIYELTKRLVEKLPPAPLREETQK